MPNLSHPAREREHVVDAFDACCDALRSVEVASALAVEDDERRIHLRKAIDQLRVTLAELRLAEEEELCLFATGLVLPVRPEWRDPAAA